MRCATTSLYAQLSKHPSISMSREKETDFFIAERNLGMGVDWYLNQFDPARPIWGEVSPNYAKIAAFPGVAERIAAFCPDVKLIFVARDPVDRAVSQYGHSWLSGASLPCPEDLPGTHEFEHLLDTSSYAAQLAEFQRFFPAENFLILDFEQLKASLQASFDRICDHIGAPRVALRQDIKNNGADELARIPTWMLRLSRGPLRPMMLRLASPALRRRVKTLLGRGKPRSVPPFPPQVLESMRDALRADAARFRAMTGMPFAGWSL